jgi:hypothetical protein
MQASNGFVQLEAGQPSKVRLILYGAEDAGLRHLMGDQLFIAAINEIARRGRCENGREMLAACERSLDFGLLQRVDSALVPGPNLVLVDSEAESGLAAALQLDLGVYAGILHEALPALRSVYETLPAAQLFGWSEVVHTIVAGFVMDLGVGREVYRQGYGLREDTTRSVLWAFAGQGPVNPFGVQCQRCAEGDGGLSQLWHRTVTRPRLQATSELVTELLLLANGTLADVSGASWLLLRQQRIVERRPSGFALLIPSFDAAALHHLQQVCDGVAAKIVSQAIVPVLRRCSALYGWTQLDRTPCVQHAALRLILEKATDRLVDAEILASFPTAASVAPSWGRWLWSERNRTR